MARLSLSFLGPFQVTLGGQPVTHFKSNKVRALLAYLAVEADRPHPREMLAGLLWPERPDRDALSNLRYALSDLRRAIGDRTTSLPFLLITRDTLQFNTASDHWLDVAAFAKGSKSEDPSSLEHATSLYQGSFLEGFSLGDSPPFEEWALFTRERLARHMSSALHRLAATYLQRGEYEQAQFSALRQVELEPWDETAHQQLMHALSLADQRSAALAQYEACRRLLAEELGVEPSPETTRLYEQIRDAEFKAAVSYRARPLDLVPKPPRFLEAEEPAEAERPVFVAREHELAQLDRFLDQALAGHGRVVFVTGDVGSGKTALVHEFVGRALEAHADLVAASGNCNAYTGVGDPYLPFREILELLTGDVEAQWAVGAMTSEHARRLWYALPVSAQALLEAGPDLIDTFVLRSALRERAMAHGQWPGRADWLIGLDELGPRRPATVSSAPGPQQSDLFKQYTRVLQVLAQRAPLLVVVDDLQWADLGSISLLFHLGRHLAGSRILMVGAYRSEEVALGRDGARHPLQSAVNEFQREFGDIAVNLSQAGSRGFLEALLDSEPNRLAAGFREMLYRQTRGHPLFTIELLRGLQERGDLVRDQEGRWREGPALDWESLPARVEAVIAERLGRLPEPLLAMLRTASVEGEAFTAEVVARVRAADEQDVVGRLSGELDRRHRLVRAQGIQRMDGQRLSRYRFRHILFQKYLYNSLDRVERAYVHEAVGNTLETLYEGQAQAMAASAGQLAWHFQEAGIAEKAIQYLHQAGDRAVHLSVNQEGITHLTKALALLMDLPEPAEKEHRLERAQQELGLQLSLGMAWMGLSPIEAEKAFVRARELCQQTGETAQLCRILGQLAAMHYVRAEYRGARELGEEALNLARRAKDPLLEALGHWHLGFILFGLGEYVAARAHLQQTISFYQPLHHDSLVFLGTADAGPSALAYDACCLWCLGYPDQALKASQKALTLAREMGHPFSLADVLSFAGCMFNAMRREPQALKSSSEELVRLAGEKGLPSWLSQGAFFQGEAMALLGKGQEGMARMREGMADAKATNARLYLPGALRALAEAQATAGHPSDGLTTLSEALALVEETGERHWEAELHRIRAEMLVMQGDEAEAEASLHKALEVARRQSAKSWELRATTSLARLWQAQGRIDEARQELAALVGWFTEGFDTPDLKDARALLEELS